MGNEDLKAIQTALFDKYKINVDEKDPIWAVLTANTALFTEYVGKMEQALIRQKSELETFKDRFIAELDKEHKDTAKNIEEKLEKLKDYEKQRRLEIDKMFENFIKGFNDLKSDEYKLNKRTLIFFFGGQIISLLLGLAVGLILF